MKFLIDNQIPPAVAYWLVKQGFDATHLLDRGLASTPDRELWEIAKAEGRIMVSKDGDFFLLATRPEETGLLLWLRVGNFRTHALIGLLEGQWDAITSAFAEGQRIVEVR